MYCVHNGTAEKTGTDRMGEFTAANKGPAHQPYGVALNAATSPTRAAGPAPRPQDDPRQKLSTTRELPNPPPP